MVDVKKLLWKNDRDFNKEEIRDQRYFLVAEHNDLITKARHDLSARELKIMDYVVSKIKPTDEHFNVLHTSMYELTSVLNLKRSGTSYSQLAKNLNDMRKKDVFIYNEKEKSITMTGWFERAKVWENGQIELKINKDFAPFLLRLKDIGHYTQYLLEDTVQLKSKYAILLYKLMREADNNHGQTIAIVQGSPYDFKEWLGAPKNYEYKLLKRNVLIKAIREINLKIFDMDLELFQAKRGRQVVQVEIHNNFVRRSSSKDL
ncbi:replication initiation protein [Lacticaseibacillus paracasei]|uniref:replication initiation protein n=1 Tax=Lacticaseibacillus paracasei TaxID=1597 RepID=UPI0034E8436F